MAFVPAPLSTETPAVELLKDVASGLEEISSRLTARALLLLVIPSKGQPCGR
ncbi:MAG: hypothetical protein ACKOPT_10570 [Cyanobium sp.]